MKRAFLEPEMEVVKFQDEDIITLHRILHVKKNGYVICGDNRWWKENVPDEWIVGVVTEFYRREEHIYITDRKYRLYVHLWCDFFWIRVLILRVKHILQRIKKK